MKNVAILGSTGSIGINTLKVIDRFSKDFRVVGLSAWENADVLSQQVRDYKPRFVAIRGEKIKDLKNQLGSKTDKTKVFDVQTDLENLVAAKDVDIVVIAMSGSAALKPFLKAVQAGKRVAPANKEALVIAGDIIMPMAKKFGAELIPIDSEQSAIFQCLKGRDQSSLHKVLLTASGGALLNVPVKKFDKLSVNQILNHPRWKMGKKITVDSASLMNKGFEVIEAKHLFGLNINQIEVLIHPEAIIHSMVEFVDGSIIGQLGITDMRLPIQYALTYPRRLNSGLNSLDFVALKQLNFSRPNFDKFPLLRVAIEVGKLGGTAPSVLNAADEVAVSAFLGKKIRFTKIVSVVEKTLQKHINISKPSLEQILSADRWAREEAQRIVEG